MIAEQRQSLLFRLPRELRDEIYAYYAFEEEGCVYDYASHKLRLTSGMKLDLTYTCKAVAHEMQGVSLRINTITFAPSCAETDEGGFRGLRSKSARYEHLLHSARWTKMLMLHHVADCITEDIIEKVNQKYPSLDSVFRLSFQAIRRGQDILTMSWRPHRYRDIFCASFCEAIQYALDLVSGHPDFDALISKACKLPELYPGKRTPFIEGSHDQILNWRPDPWSIPHDEEICALEYLLTQPHSADGFDCAGDYQPLRHYFSATAICIATLGRLNPVVRMQIRSIVLQEDCKAVSNPEAHADGLIRFCTENPRLHILLKAGFSTNLVPSLWAISSSRSSCPYTATMTQIHDYFCVIVDWLIRTATLPSRGMTPGSFVVTLEVSSTEATQIWRQIEKAAALRGALPNAIEQDAYVRDTDRKVLTGPFASIWRLPKQFSLVIEDIVKGVSLIQLQDCSGVQWDAVALNERCRSWSLVSWYMNFRPLLDSVVVPGGPDAYFMKYYVDPTRRTD